jgi:long-chain acyl-CoA synthetase
MFHVTANHSLLTQVTAFGGKIALMHKWNVEEAVRLIRPSQATCHSAIAKVLAKALKS